MKGRFTILDLIFLFLISIYTSVSNFEREDKTYPMPIPFFKIGDIVPEVTIPISLLSLSKIELQEHIRPTHEIDLIEVLSYVIKTYENMVKKNNINLNLQKTENFKIIGDRDKLIEIFTNLIDNSIKYSEKGKEIKIATKKEGDLNIVSISDQGIGIPKEFIHRITERFFTVDPSKSRSVGGTGLGLAIVKHLVSQHRGEMIINSEENQGTTIDLKFNSI